MIKLFSLKQQKKEEESAGGTKGSSKKASAAQLRIQKGKGSRGMGVEVGGQSLARGDTGVRCGVMRLPGVKGVRNGEAADVGIGDQGLGAEGPGVGLQYSHQSGRR